MWDIIFEKYMLFLLVFIRMTGMIFFNPIYSKKNIPTNLKVGFAFFLALAVSATLPNVTFQYVGIPVFMLAGLKELMVGFFASFIFNIFLSAILVAGEIIDLQLGVGMSEVYDPQSNVSMPLSGTIYNLIFMLIFFLGNGHLTMIKIMTLSFQILPVGPHLLNFEAGQFILALFGNILILAVKIALPVIAIELFVETGLGVLMRTVPQINIFVAGLQLKLLVGIIIIIILLPSFSNLIDLTITTMFENIAQGMKLLA